MSSSSGRMVNSPDSWSVQRSSFLSLPREDADCPLSRMQQDLRLAVLVVVEGPVGVGSFVEGEVIGDDEARGGAPGDDQVAQLVSVLLRIGLAGAHLLSLLEEASHAEQQLALGGMLIRSTGVRRQ